MLKSLKQFIVVFLIQSIALNPTLSAMAAGFPTSRSSVNRCTVIEQQALSPITIGARFLPFKVPSRLIHLLGMRRPSNVPNEPDYSEIILDFGAETETPQRYIMAIPAGPDYDAVLNALEIQWGIFRTTIGDWDPQASTGKVTQAFLDFPKADGEKFHAALQTIYETVAPGASLRIFALRSTSEVTLWQNLSPVIFQLETVGFKINEHPVMANILPPKLSASTSHFLWDADPSLALPESRDDYFSDRFMEITAIKRIPRTVPMSVIGRWGGVNVYGFLMPVLEESARYAFRQVVAGQPFLTGVVGFSIFHALLHFPIDIYEVGWQFWRRIPQRLLLSVEFGFAGWLGSFFDTASDGHIELSASMVLHSFHNIFVADVLEKRLGWTGLTMSITGRKPPTPPAPNGPKKPSNRERDMAKILQLAQNLGQFVPGDPQTESARQKTARILTRATLSPEEDIRLVAMAAVAKAQWVPAIPFLVRGLRQEELEGMMVGAYFAFYRDPHPIIDYLRIRLDTEKEPLRVSTKGQAAFFVELLKKIEDEKLWDDVSSNLMTPSPLVVEPLVEEFPFDTLETRERILRFLMSNEEYLNQLANLLTNNRYSDNAGQIFSSRPELSERLFQIARTPADPRAFDASRILIKMGPRSIFQIVERLKVSNENLRLPLEAFASMRTEALEFKMTLIIFGILQSQGVASAVSKLRPLDGDQWVLAAGKALQIVGDARSFSRLIEALNDPHLKPETRETLRQRIPEWDGSRVSPNNLVQVFDMKNPKLESWAYDALLEKGLEATDEIRTSLDVLEWTMHPEFRRLSVDSAFDFDSSLDNPAEDAAQHIPAYHRLLSNIAERNMAILLRDVLDPEKNEEAYLQAYEHFHRLQIYSTIPLAHLVRDPVLGPKAAEVLREEFIKDDFYKNDLISRLLPVLTEELYGRNGDLDTPAKIRLNTLIRLLLKKEDDGAPPQVLMTKTLENLFPGVFFGWAVAAMTSHHFWGAALAGPLWAIPIHLLIHEGAHALAVYHKTGEVRFKMSWRGGLSVLVEKKTFGNTAVGPLSAGLLGLYAFVVGVLITHSPSEQSVGLTLMAINVLAALHRSPDSDAEIIVPRLKQLLRVAV